jgi:hypothetical protein
MLRPRSTLVVTAGLLAAALVLAPAGAAPSASVADPCAGGGAPALRGAAALSLLPADTLFVAAVADPAGALDTFGRARMVERFRAEYDEAAAAVKAATGHDLLDPATWPQIGVDPHGPLGFAWLDLADETFAVFATLTDAAALESFLVRVGAREQDPVTATAVGAARVLRTTQGGHFRLVLRDGQAVLIFSGEGDEVAEAAARTVAQQGPADSLAASAAFRGALDGLAFGTAGALWLDLRRVFELVTTTLDDRAEVSWWQMELDRARNEGRADDVAYFRSRLDEERETHADRLARRELQRAFLMDLAASTGSLAVGVELGRREVRLRAVADLPRDSLLGRLIRPGDGVPLLVRALGERPLHLSHARLDLDAALALFERFLAADGEDLDEGRRALRAELGLDLDHDIVAAFDGELGVAVTGAIPSRSDGGTVDWSGLGGALVAGVRDEGKARALLERTLGRAELSALATRTPTGGFRVAVPFWRTLHVEIAGGALLVTTDEGFVARARTGAAGAWLSGLGTEGLGALLRDDRAAGTYVADLSLFASWLLAFEGGFGGGPMAELVEGLGGPGEVPLSPESRRIADEIAALERSIREQEEATQRQQADATKRLVELFGTTAKTGRVEGDRVATCGGLYVAADSLEAFGEGLVANLVALAKTDEQRSQLWDQRDRLWLLQEEYTKQRLQDGARP